MKKLGFSVDSPLPLPELFTRFFFLNILIFSLHEVHFNEIDTLYLTHLKIFQLFSNIKKTDAVLNT